MSTSSSVKIRSSAVAVGVENAGIPVPEVPFSTTLLVRDCCMCLHVQRAARSLARRFDAALKPVGLTNGQFSLLMSLNRPIAQGVPLATVGSVAELLGMDRTTLTAAARVLYGRGLLTLEPEPQDRRSKILRLTDEGKRVLAAATPIWVREHKLLESGISDPKRLRRELVELGKGA